MEAEFFDPLVGGDDVVECGDLDVDVLHSGANRVDGQRVHRCDRDGVVAFVDAQESDLELHAVDRLVDVVGQSGVEGVVVVAADLVRLLREQGDVTESACAGDESGAGYLQGHGCGAGGGVDLLGKPVGPGEAQEAFDSAQRGLLVGALDGGYPVVDDAAVDFVEGRVVIEVPTQRNDVLGRSPPQQESAFVGIEAESDRVGCHVVAVHADGVAGRSGASRRTCSFR